MMSSPLVYMQQNQVQKAYQNFITSQTDLSPSVAFGFDEGDVFHVYTFKPQIPVSGYSCESAVKFLDQMPKGEDGFTVANQVIQTIGKNEIARPGSNTVLVLFAMEAETNELCHRVFIRNSQGQLKEGILKFIPENSEIYSRNQGLLETSILERKKIGIVGLGSGGSTLAVELAKAGVGNFVLMDFDRLELANISRHVCGIGDLGRYKTKAVRDLLYGKNPYVNVETAEIDINENPGKTNLLLKQCDLIIGATDNNRSRFNLNKIALENKITSIFGRALTRACGGDILRVRPYDGPCLGCVFTKEFLESRQEEISQFKQAREETPAYVSDQEVSATIQVGLSSDILPISNMIVKLALVELCRDLESGIASLEEDLVADFYIWANRREQTYANWPKMLYDSRTPSILRWYGAKWKRNLSCPVCGEEHQQIDDEENIFAA